jgi:hypothetical protein
MRNIGVLQLAWLANRFRDSSSRIFVEARGEGMLVERASVSGAAALLLAACAIHPVPEDFSGVDTYHIVWQIPCETREAVRELILKELKRLGSDHEDQRADPLAARLADEYEAHPEAISKVFVGKNCEEVRNFYNII